MACRRLRFCASDSLRVARAAESKFKLHLPVGDIALDIALRLPVGSESRASESEVTAVHWQSPGSSIYLRFWNMAASTRDSSPEALFTSLSSCQWAGGRSELLARAYHDAGQWALAASRAATYICCHPHRMRLCAAVTDRGTSPVRAVICLATSTGTSYNVHAEFRVNRFNRLL